MNDQVQAEQVNETEKQLVEAVRQEMRASKFQAFADYAVAYWAMQDDPLVRFIKLQVAELNNALEQAEYSYKLSMADFGKDIEAVVLELGQTVEVAGVTAKYTKGIARPSWKSVAMTFEPSRELIDEHTKVGKPSVRIKIAEGETS